MVNVKGRCKAHGSEQQEFCIFKKQKKQKGEPGMRTAIFPENGRRMICRWINDNWKRAIKRTNKR